MSDSLGAEKRREAGCGPLSSQEPEAALIERCQAGSLEAFDRLIALHENTVYRTALRLLGDAEDAADLAQEVWLTVFRKIGQFRADSRFSTWLYQITVNQARNRWRAEARRPREVSMDAPLPGEEDSSEANRRDPPPDPAPSPRERAAGREALAALQRELARLPESFREILILRHVENLSYEEIAEVLDAELGTVKSRLARARDLLRERLGPVLDEFFAG